MDEKEKISKQVFIIIGIISIIILAIIVAAVVINANTKPEVIKETKEGADITLNYAGESSGLALTDMKATKDDVGMKVDSADSVFNFTVNTDLIEADKASYEIFVTKNKKDCNINDEYLKVYLEKESDGTFNKVIDPMTYKALTKKDEMGVKKGSMVLFKDNVNESKAINYRLKMWLSDKYTPKEGEKVNCSIELGIVGEAK